MLKKEADPHAAEDPKKTMSFHRQQPRREKDRVRHLIQDSLDDVAISNKEREFNKDTQPCSLNTRSLL